MVGDGPMRAELEELLGDSATFTGWLQGEDLAAAFASADIFVFPSSVDTSGQVILEAQASGLPAVVCSEGGACENIEPGKTGFTARSRSLSDFNREIESLLDDEGLRRAMSARRPAVWLPAVPGKASSPASSRSTPTWSTGGSSIPTTAPPAASRPAPRLRAHCLRPLPRWNGSVLPGTPKTPALFLFAHHDDEFFIAVTMRRLAAARLPVTAVWLTRGGLHGERREAESRRAMELIGVKPSDQYFLRLADGHAIDHLDEIVERLTRLFEEIKPASVFVPAFEGGHPDHDTAQLAAAVALKRSRIEPAQTCDSPPTLRIPTLSSRRREVAAGSASSSREQRRSNRRR